MRKVHALIPLVIGLPIFVLGLYLMPSAAYDIQRAFRQSGARMTAVVIETGRDERTYVDGTGQYGRRNSFEERIVVVQVPNGDVVTIAHLVLDSDLERLKPGDEVAVSHLERGIETHDQGSRTVGRADYLLASSLDAGPMSLLGWSRGRGWSGGCIAALVVGGLFMSFAVIILVAIFRYGDEEEPRVQAAA